VLATDVSALRQIVDGSPGLGDDGWRAQVAALATAPPFVVQRLWLDQPVRADRAPFLGTGGRPPLDNVSVLERYEREAASWSGRTGGSVVELHSYAVTGAPDDLDDRMLTRLYELYPEAKDANVVHERTLVRQDCPRFAPGDHARRPTVETPHPAVMLAGDGIRIDLPVALMERAATTGWSAANRLLDHYGIAGHALHTVPVRGRSPALRRLAEREVQPAR
jgi:carotenoid phi-ring synthase / carotenoid chi-ring synthase